MVQRLAVVVLFLLSQALGAGSPGSQPVYIYLYSHIDDHVHSRISEERLARTLTLLEKFQNRNPEAHVSAVLQFSGAMAGRLESKDGDSGILGRVKDCMRRGMIEVGYRGTDEPTRNSRPGIGFRGHKSASEWWLLRSRTANSLLADYKEPLYGTPDSRRSGGLKRTAEVFGTVSEATGMTPETGRDTEFIDRMKELGILPLSSGLLEPDPSRNLHGYRDAVRTFGKLMSPQPNSSPELFWQDGALHLSETSDPAIRVLRGFEGIAGAKKVLDGVDRSKPHIIHLELAGQELYLQPDYGKGFLYPPVRFAYDHPDRPALPPEALRSQKEIDDAYATEESLIKYLVDVYFPANSGSGFLSTAEVARMAGGPGIGRRVSQGQLKKAAAELLTRWGASTFPPDFIRSEEEYFSLADMFQLLADGLAVCHFKGTLPEYVTLADVYGPEEMTDQQGQELRRVSAADVAAAASAVLAGRSKGIGSSTLLGKLTPSWIVIDGKGVNAAQFLHMMAQCVTSQSSEVDVKPAQMFSSLGEMYPRSVPRSDMGSVWTLKPVMLHLPDKKAK